MRLRVFAVALLAAGISAAPKGAQPTDGPRVEISFAASARHEPVTGMVYLALSRDNRESPIEQTSPTGVPLFSHYVENLAPGAAVTLTSADRGYPIASLRDVPAGDYWVQPFVNVYTRFPRADGHVVWMHMDQWEGQNWKRSPDNIYGTPVHVHLDPSSGTPLRLVADTVIPPIAVPPDTPYVKHIKIKSDILSAWWGQPIHLGATVLLPRGYDEHPDVRYPVNYIQGHFSLGAPGGFGRTGRTGRGGRGADFDALWVGDDTPRFIYVTLQHPSPYYDDSYGVNSENNGPYGDAIMKELLPAVEQRFRVIREPWARLLSGGSTGGWIALAQQIFYPDFYGGTFASCPDSVDFDYHQIVNVYDDANAYYLDRGWMKIDRPNQRRTDDVLGRGDPTRRAAGASQRRPDGSIVSMMKDENRYELTVGDHSRSGGQWDIWEATYSPAGPDGYPRRVWNKETGEIDHAVAAQWKKYDLLNVLKTNWPTLGPKLADKLNVYVGDMDSYYLNDAVENLHTFLSHADNPKWTGEILTERRAPHCWGPSQKELLDKMAAQLERGGHRVIR